MNRITLAILMATFLSTSALAVTLHFARKMIEGSWRDNELDLARFEGCTCARVTGSARLLMEPLEAYN